MSRFGFDSHVDLLAQYEVMPRQRQEQQQQSVVEIPDTVRRLLQGAFEALAIAELQSLAILAAGRRAQTVAAADVARLCAVTTHRFDWSSRAALLRSTSAASKAAIRLPSVGLPAKVWLAIRFVEQLRVKADVKLQKDVKEYLRGHLSWLLLHLVHWLLTSARAAGRPSADAGDLVAAIRDEAFLHAGYAAAAGEPAAVSSDVMADR